MSQITQLASGAITAADTITVELIEADETPQSCSSDGTRPGRCGRAGL